MESELLVVDATETRCIQAGYTNLLKKLIAVSDEVAYNKEVVFNLLSVLQIQLLYYIFSSPAFAL